MTAKSDETRGLKIPVSPVRSGAWAPDELENRRFLQPGSVTDPRFGADSQSQSSPEQPQQCVPILPGEQTFVRSDRWVTYADHDRHSRIVRAGVRATVLVDRGTRATDGSPSADAYVVTCRTRAGLGGGA